MAMRSLDKVGLRLRILPIFATLLVVGAITAVGALAAPGPAARAATLPAVTCTLNAGVRTCDLWATTGTVSLPGASVTVWGYADVDASPATLPGPTLIANQGETVEVALHNDLAETTALQFVGLEIIPDLVGVAPGGTVTYTLPNVQPGTYLYEAGPLPNAQHQAAMGMYGALVVRPTAAPPAGYNGQAYASTDTAYHDEALVLLSEIDPSLNNSADPAVFDMRNTNPGIG
ncbi:MAG: multicopper oxidase domain-containing protein [Anaerolineae bacterium]|nr:multicopper oxidase domain-containing protein [Anaerolineae bacterium]